VRPAGLVDGGFSISASDNPTLLHPSYIDAVTFLPWLRQATVKIDQRGDLARLGTPPAGAVCRAASSADGKFAIRS
jgi:hypothetical protein